MYNEYMNTEYRQWVTTLFLAFIPPLLFGTFLWSLTDSTTVLVTELAGAVAFVMTMWAGRPATWPDTQF